MQRGERRVETDGGRIYDLVADQRKYNEANNQTEQTFDRHEAACDINQNALYAYNTLSVSAPFDDILTVLDQQVEKLQVTTTSTIIRESDSALGNTTGPCDNLVGFYQKSDSILDERPLTGLGISGGEWSGGSLRVGNENSLSRKRELSEYIKQRIEGDKGECGCHFNLCLEKSTSSSPLSVSLSESVEKCGTEKRKLSDSSFEIGPQQRQQVAELETENCQSVKGGDLHCRYSAKTSTRAHQTGAGFASERAQSNLLFIDNLPRYNPSDQQACERDACNNCIACATVATTTTTTTSTNLDFSSSQQSGGDCSSGEHKTTASIRDKEHSEGAACNFIDLCNSTPSPSVLLDSDQALFNFCQEQKQTKSSQLLGHSTSNEHVQELEIPEFNISFDSSDISNEYIKSCELSNALESLKGSEENSNSPSPNCSYCVVKEQSFLPFQPESLREAFESETEFDENSQINTGDIEDNQQVDLVVDCKLTNNSTFSLSRSQDLQLQEIASLIDSTDGFELNANANEHCQQRRRPLSTTASARPRKGAVSCESNSNLSESSSAAVNLALVGVAVCAHQQSEREKRRRKKRRRRKRGNCGGRSKSLPTNFDEQLAPPPSHYALFEHCENLYNSSESLRRRDTLSLAARKMGFGAENGKNNNGGQRKLTEIDSNARRDSRNNGSNPPPPSSSSSVDCMQSTIELDKPIPTVNKKQTRNHPSAGLLGAKSASPTAGQSKQHLDCLAKEAAHDASMRAVKDIAKISVPSLSALQFLPGQLDMKFSHSMDGQSGAGGSGSYLGKKKQSLPDQGDEKKGAAHTVMSESRDDLRDNSCLLHRLCLCNCMARGHNVKQIQAAPSEAAKVDDVASSAVSQMSLSSEQPQQDQSHDLCVKSTLASKLKSAGRLPGKSEGISRQFLSGLRREKEREKSKNAPEDERQSPLAVSTTARNESSERSHEASRKAADISEQRRCSSSAYTTAPIGRHCNSSELSSAGNLIATPFTSNFSDYSESSANESIDNVRHRSPPRTRSSSFTHCESCKNKENKLAPNNSKKKISNSSPSSAYRKFLSPSRLFTSPVSSVCDCQSQDSIGHEKEKSFFSRSLNRLSGVGGGGGRSKKNSAKRHKHQVAGPIDQHSLESDQRNSADGSTDISISNASPQHQQDSSNNSLISSLEDIKIAHRHTSLPFEINRESKNNYNRSRLCVGPEIVLNRVEFLNSNNSLSSCDMARTSSSRNGFRSGRHSATPAYRHSSGDHHLSEVESSHRDTRRGGATLSLPGSPRLSRRRNNQSPRLSHSPVSFKSPATESSKIEDGLKVCSTEHFEKHISNIKDTQIEAQKRLFTAWINHFCPNLIRRDLISELQDGIKLIGILASLTHDKSLLAQYEKLNRDKQSFINRLVITPSSRLKHLSNVSIAIEHMRKNLSMKLVNLNPMDIVSGKANVILGLCWNIILNFQLEQNYLKFSDASQSSNSSSYFHDHSKLNHSQSLNTSRCSHSSSSVVTNTDRRQQVYNVGKNICQMIQKTPNLNDEYTQRDLVKARTRILEIINKRFNLKLTNLSSNLMDGNVLLVIIKQLMLHSDDTDNASAANHLLDDSRTKVQLVDENLWNRMSDDEKLDHCFNLAAEHLSVPQLFSAADLRHQSLSENNSKPLLVYLSMLLNSKPQNCFTEQLPELRQLDKTLDRQSQVSSENNRSATDKSVDENPEFEFEFEFESYLKAVDTEDKFGVEKLQTTLTAIKKYDQLIKVRTGDRKKVLDESLEKRHELLKANAERVENLIAWINKADKLFETSFKSSTDLGKAIEEYQKFFSSSNLPSIESSSTCPILVRQYRECLATARQRVLSMEQTMKNWINYEQSRLRLRNWLVNAETKLATALRPINQTSGHNEISDPIEQHMSNLDDLIDYFELEPVDIDDISARNPAISSSTNSLDTLNNRSLSSSMLSLGSTSSRMSALTNSKKASYYRLFDDFELKCRLLAAMLDSDQRDALLLGVKELKARLRYISECRVPQVVSELKFNINRCELSIAEQDESLVEISDSETPAEQSEKDHSPHQKQLSKDNPDSLLISSGIVSDGATSTEGQDLVDVPASSPKARIKNLTFKPTKKRRTKNRRSRGKGPPESDQLNKSVKAVAKSQPSSTGSAAEFSLIGRIWQKIVRVSRISMSFNIVLLICLAGICVLPLINKDACCELAQAPIPKDILSSYQRPT